MFTVMSMDMETVMIIMVVTVMVMIMIASIVTTAVVISLHQVVTRVCSQSTNEYFKIVNTGAGVPATSLPSCRSRVTVYSNTCSEAIFFAKISSKMILKARLIPDSLI